MKKKNLPIALLLLLGSMCCPLKAKDKKVYVIDKSKTYQQIDNFGASDAWRIHFIGKYWPEKKREQLADLLFSRKFDDKGNPVGMGLSNWRVNIGAGSYENREYKKEVIDTWNRVECFLSPEGSYDFGKQAGQQWFMKAAKERGMNNFLFFTNSAPYFMTRSAATLSPDNKYINLQEDKFDDFARFLVECAKHFQKQGFNVNYISPINEPDVEWNTNPHQEGSVATKGDIYRMVSELDKAISESGLNTKIVISEMGNMKNLFETDATDKIPDDIIHSMFSKKGKYSVLGFKNLYNCVSAHDYWTAYPPTLLTDIRMKIKESLDNNRCNTKFWASEYCILEKNEEITMPDSPVKSINRGLYVARIIHNDLALANASAWQWWTAVSFGEEVPVQLRTLKDSSFESLKYDGIITPTKMLWTTANYSFFIRPGMKRIDIKPVNHSVTPLEAATSLMLSSYANDKEMVTVIINYTETDEKVELKCPDTKKKGKMYVTSIDKNLEYTGEHPLDNLTIPARSVVTVVSNL